MSSLKDIKSEVSVKEKPPQPSDQQSHMRWSIESLLTSRNSEKLIVNIIPEKDTIGGNDKENEHKNVIREEIQMVEKLHESSSTK